MKHLNVERAKERYDKICYDHIAEEASTLENPGWNIRDLVAEAAYWLGTFYDEGHEHYMLIDPLYADEETRKEWRSATGKLERFIAAYEPFIDNVVCTESHGSKYDNCPNPFK